MSLYKEDVYETEDPPVPEPASMADQFENKEIEKIHMDLQGAKRRFGNCILYSESTDFSDSVATMRLKRGYKAAEIYESEPTEEETFERKYSRICLEVKELLAEVEKDPNSIKFPKAEIVELNDLLKSLTKTPSMTNEGQNSES